ncbi:MAG: rRNA pseudouridine synthase [Lachnospiraceae bacterium]|nr:rRNA pseudouridine synthase [Lachnospiraceae bacterium]
MRLDRYLADMGIGTRSGLKKAIRAGAIFVNGVPVKKADTAVGPEDRVEYEGKPVVWHAVEYYMMNKPAGVISATEDPRQRTVLDLLPPGTRRDLAPVGRLDKDTEGLLLLTNDGQLAHSLLAPGRHVPKQYLAKLDRPFSDEDVRRFAEGLSVPEDGTAGTARGRAAFRAAPARLWAAEDKDEDKDTWAVVEITEGRYHQVKRMFAAVGKQVLFLKRLSMGTLVLDPALAPGQVRPLTGEELRTLHDSVGRGRTGTV